MSLFFTGTPRSTGIEASDAFPVNSTEPSAAPGNLLLALEPEDMPTLSLAGT